MRVEFVVGSRPHSEGFSLGSPAFLPPQKFSTSKFQYDRLSKGHRFMIYLFTSVKINGHRSLQERTVRFLNNK